MEEAEAVSPGPPVLSLSLIYLCLSPPPNSQGLTSSSSQSLTLFSSLWLPHHGFPTQEVGSGGGDRSSRGHGWGTALGSPQAGAWSWNLVTRANQAWLATWTPWQKKPCLHLVHLCRFPKCSNKLLMVFRLDLGLHTYTGASMGGAASFAQGTSAGVQPGKRPGGAGSRHAGVGAGQNPDSQRLGVGAASGPALEPPTPSRSDPGALPPPQQGAPLQTPPSPQTLTPGFLQLRGPRAGALPGGPGCGSGLAAALRGRTPDAGSRGMWGSERGCTPGAAWCLQPGEQGSFAEKGGGWGPAKLWADPGLAARYPDPEADSSRAPQLRSRLSCAALHAMPRLAQGQAPGAPTRPHVDQLPPPRMRNTALPRHAGRCSPDDSGSLPSLVRSQPNLGPAPVLLQYNCSWKLSHPLSLELGVI